jgi:hypothetical protein
MFLGRDKKFVVEVNADHSTAGDDRADHLIAELPLAGDD